MEDQKGFIADLKERIRGDVLDDLYSLGIYATDASLYQIFPKVVVLPKDEDDVLTALVIANEYKVTVLPRGGGTSLAGQTVGSSMILDFSKYMDKVLEVNAEERWVRVQPGVVRDVLNMKLEQYGLHFAPDPATSSRANIGGMVANNSSGTKSVLYGKSVDHVLEMKIALADGTVMRLRELSQNEIEQKSQEENREGEIYRKFREIIFETSSEVAEKFPKVMRRVGGYLLDEFVDKEEWNLSKVITGSEGTLATILEVKINLEPLPETKALSLVHFDSLQNAIKAVSPILKYQPSAVEILDETVIELARKNLTKIDFDFIEGNPVAVLIVEFYGDSFEDVNSRYQLMKVDEELKELSYHCPFFPEGEIFNHVWTIRKKGLGLLLGMKGDKKPVAFIEDASIPIQVLPEYIENVRSICDKYETDAAMYAHASVGVIHVRPILDMRDPEDLRRFKNISRETFALVKQYGGSWSGEHGDGLVRSKYNKEFFGEKIYNAFIGVKRLFDPENRMNPGKIVEAQDIDQNMRYGWEYVEKKTESIYKYREDLNFENAVHMCSGVGECRKVKGGTMCPSYRVTRDEEHSTRGRANALRLAMSGQLGEAGLTDERLFEVLDLCLSCKACKSECPSNVDMAKLKSEVWQKRFDKHGLTRRDKFIRNSTNYARKFSGSLSGLINTVQKTSVFRSTLQNLAGIDRRRILPSYSNHTFAKWFKNNYTPSSGNIMMVALFADTYLNYHEPEIGISATRLLDHLGYKVVLADVGCCQRPRISHGFLRDAKKDGTEVAKSLEEWIDMGVPVLVCEPSCATALTDDIPDLLDDENLGRKLSGNVLLLETFIAREHELGKIKLNLSSKHEEILIHGHCHQKASFGTAAIHDIFKQVDGLKFSEVDSGCCGMAGAFGYEKEHYDISKKVGEQVLFPTLRELDEDTGIVACGFSCRHQIEHFTSRTSKHWIELVSPKVKSET